MLEILSVSIRNALFVKQGDRLTTRGSCGSTDKLDHLLSYPAITLPDRGLGKYFGGSVILKPTIRIYNLPN